jgi:protein-S-isoprenylcysteine O-methyltransferase Ste14
MTARSMQHLGRLTHGRGARRNTRSTDRFVDPARPAIVGDDARVQPSRTTRLPDLGPRGEGWVAIQGILFVLIALAGTLGPAWGEPWLAAGRAVGLALIVGGGGLAVLGVLGLRENLSAVPRPVEGGRLIDSGVYGLVRHPIYTGIVAAALGWSLFTASLPALALAGVLGVFFDLKSRREEAWLLATYPAYDDYRRRVRKLVPLVY